MIKTNKPIKQALKYIVLLCASAMIVACSSKVPLNDPVKVEDRTGQVLIPPMTSNTGASSGGLGTRDIQPVDLTPVQADVAGRILYFDFDSYAIKPQFQSLIEAQAKRLNADRNSKMALAGHTDEMGGREYNLSLGQKRAEAVKRALSLLGVQEAQLEAVSYGKEKPAATGSDEAAAAKNRRVELSNR